MEMCVPKYNVVTQKSYLNFEGNIISYKRGLFKLAFLLFYTRNVVYEGNFSLRFI